MDAIPFETECWIWYPIVLSVVIARFASQWIARKDNRLLKNIQYDDMIMLFATCTYTVVIITLYLYQQIIVNTDFDDLSESDYGYYEHQSCMLILLCETALQVTLWSCKICLLFFYKHLTQTATRNIPFMAAGTLVLSTFVVVIVVLYTECRPASQFFLFQPNSDECLTWWHYNIVQLSLNISTDLVLLVMFWVLVVPLKLPIIRKVLLLMVFGLGMFVMVAAILTKRMVFEAPTQPTWVQWYLREVCTAMLVGNLILCFPLLLAFFKFCKRNISTISASRTLKSRNHLGDAEPIKREHSWERIELQSQPSFSQLVNHDLDMENQGEKT